MCLGSVNFLLSGLNNNKYTPRTDSQESIQGKVSSNTASYSHITRGEHWSPPVRTSVYRLTLWLGPCGEQSSCGRTSGQRLLALPSVTVKANERSRCAAAPATFPVLRGHTCPVVHVLDGAHTQQLCHPRKFPWTPDLQSCLSLKKLTFWSRKAWFQRALTSGCV